MFLLLSEETTATVLAIVLALSNIAYLYFKNKLTAKQQKLIESAIDNAEQWATDYRQRHGVAPQPHDKLITAVNTVIRERRLKPSEELVASLIKDIEGKLAMREQGPQVVTRVLEAADLQARSKASEKKKE